MPAVFSSLPFIVFASSLGAILLLFALKSLEWGHERRFAEGLRVRADKGALRVKDALIVTERTLENIPWFVAALARYSVHIGALSFARVARLSALQAHKLADLVSHKRGFEHRETKSKFLKDVGEHPIRNRDGSIGTGTGMES